MGSTCSSNAKSSDEDFFEQYGNFSTAAKTNHEAPPLPAEALQALKSQLSTRSSGAENESTFSGSNGVLKYPNEPAKSDIDWNFLEKSIQHMNLNILRDDLDNNPKQFLINQILMSFQFYKNFER